MQVALFCLHQKQSAGEYIKKGALPIPSPSTDSPYFKLEGTTTTYGQSLKNEDNSQVIDLQPKEEVSISTPLETSLRQPTSFASPCEPTQWAEFNLEETTITSGQALKNEEISQVIDLPPKEEVCISTPSENSLRQLNSFALPCEPTQFSEIHLDGTTSGQTLKNEENSQVIDLPPKEEVCISTPSESSWRQHNFCATSISTEIVVGLNMPCKLTSPASQQHLFSDNISLQASRDSTYRADTMIKTRPPSKRRYDHIIFEEPLINISMEPTEEVDPLFIDPTTESIDDEEIGDFTINGLSIFSPKVGDFKQKTVSCKSPEKKMPPNIIIKQEVDSVLGVKIKEEPKDCDDDFEMELQEAMEHEEEIDPVEELAKALDQVEYLCPKCTFRSPDKEEVSHHFVTSHRIAQIGIPRPCDKCDFIGKTVRELSYHKKQKHPRTIIQDSLPTLPTGEFQCPHCEFNSFHKNNVRSHMKVHTQDTVYTCDKCPYTAINKLNIENHAARHLMKPKNKKKWKYQCKHCGLWERTEKLLQRHLILHGEGEMLKCQLCPYKSPYSHIITMHTRICHRISSSKNDENDDRWYSRRSSTRSCTRDKKNYNEEKVEDFYENLPKRPYRRKKPLAGTKDDESKEDEPKPESNENTPEEDREKPKRPTLEERLGRARDLISKTLPSKKDKDSEKEESSKDKDDDEKESSGEEKQSEGSEEEGEKTEDDWSDGESEFDGGTEDESMQSSTSDRQTIDSASKDNDNSNTDSDIFKTKSLSIKENSNDSFKSNKSKKGRASKNKNDDESSAKQLDKKDKTDEETSKDDVNKEMSENEDSNDSGPAVLVLKRKGASFTSFLKNNSDSS